MMKSGYTTSYLIVKTSPLYIIIVIGLGVVCVFGDYIRFLGKSLMHHIAKSCIRDPSVSSHFWLHMTFCLGYTSNWSLFTNHVCIYVSGPGSWIRAGLATSSVPYWQYIINWYRVTIMATYSLLQFLLQITPILSPPRWPLIYSYGH